MSPFLSSLLFFFLHVRALLGAAGPGHYWSLNPPSCKGVRCQTSSDLQLRAHAISLLLWVIKGKWEHSVQILPAILNMHSFQSTPRTDPDHMAKGGKQGITGKAGGMEGLQCSNTGDHSTLSSCSTTLFIQKYQTLKIPKFKYNMHLY